MKKRKFAEPEGENRRLFFVFGLSPSSVFLYGWASSTVEDRKNHQGLPEDLSPDSRKKSTKAGRKKASMRTGVARPLAARAGRRRTGVPFGVPFGVATSKECPLAGLARFLLKPSLTSNF